MKTPSEPRARARTSKNARPTSKNPSRRSAREKRKKLHLPLLAAPDPGPTFSCAECGLCCTYLAIEIDGPTSVKRATELLWYLYHEDVSLYVNDDSWMVQFETTCRYLTADKRCGIYATRPHICREYSEKECEINTGDDGHTFYTPAAFMTYLKQTRPRVHALVMKGYAPPAEPKRGLHPFERRQRDVYVRRAALGLESPHREAPVASTSPKKPKASGAATDTL